MNTISSSIGAILERRPVVSGEEDVDVLVVKQKTKWKVKTTVKFFTDKTCSAPVGTVRSRCRCACPPAAPRPLPSAVCGLLADCAAMMRRWRSSR